MRPWAAVVTVLLVLAWCLAQDRGAKPSAPNSAIKPNQLELPAHAALARGAHHELAQYSRGASTPASTRVAAAVLAPLPMQEAAGVRSERPGMQEAGNSAISREQARAREKSSDATAEDNCRTLAVAPGFDFDQVEWIYDLTPTQAIAYRRLSESPHGDAHPKHLFDLLHAWIRQHLCWLEADPLPNGALYQLVLVNAYSHVSVWVGADWFSDGAGVVAVHPEQVAELARVVESRRQGPGPNQSREEFERWLAARADAS